MASWESQRKVIREVFLSTSTIVTYSPKFRYGDTQKMSIRNQNKLK